MMWTYVPHLVIFYVLLLHFGLGDPSPVIFLMCGLWRLFKRSARELSTKIFYFY